MFGWFLVSGGLFYCAFLTKTPERQRLGLTLLMGWVLFTIGMLLLGGPESIRD